ncbi:hypothetical protein BJX68DRAFT_237585 [Aspergillus pseudodeflectus]|uniref:Thioredoxin domain-containing protein n=1 Tax=Aspergillus pseudodeflectus TaxID=176178 RepID=A0ABR4KBS9_9EURO
MGNGLGFIALPADYDEKVTTHHGPVVVEFYDESCAHAKAIPPWVTHLANKYFEVVEFYEVNVREESTRDDCCEA